MSDFSPGLEGVLAARTVISMVDGQNGRLVYRGYVIADLAEDMSYEEVVHLLWHGELPNRTQLDEIGDKLRSKRNLDSAAQAALKALAAETHPMDVLRTVVSAQGASAHLVKPDIEQAIANVAVFPTLLAAFHRQRQGKEWLAPRADLGHAANYLYMLTGEEPAAELVHALNTYLVLLADHGMNASTFTARVIASTDSDLASCLVGAIGALKGPAHGGAPSAVMEQLEEIGTADNAEHWGREALERHQRFMGFGHRVYRTYDPRAKILKALCERLNPELLRPGFEMGGGRPPPAHRAPPGASPGDQRRVLLGGRAAGGRPPDRLLPRHLRHLPRRGLDRPRPRAGLSQPPHPAPVGVHRTRAQEARTARQTLASGQLTDAVLAGSLRSGWYEEPVAACRLGCRLLLGGASVILAANAANIPGAPALPGASQHQQSGEQKDATENQTGRQGQDPVGAGEQQDQAGDQGGHQDVPGTPDQSGDKQD